MMLRHLVTFSVLLACVIVTGAAAQDASQLAGIGQGTDWTLAAPQAKPGRRSKAGTPPGSVAVDPKRARDEELRRDFYANQARAAERKPTRVPEFGGYDAATQSGDGSFRPGATFKF